MAESITVHMIGAAHIDPVWLWRWPAGAVEALSTCRTAVELLDRHPDFEFCRSDVWIHELVELHDPDLFQRIRRYVDQGRWHVVGGWYIQPDCNHPCAESFRQHMRLGSKYFGDKLGIRVDVGFNVDSFGHSASLPGLLAEFGYDSYVMMRPMQNECSMDTDLFRWCGNGPQEVVTWRIQKSYNAASPGMLTQNIQAAVAAAEPGVPHVMCFYGVGDHGGGPTEELISWIEDHCDDQDEVYRLEFSNPRRFFDSVGRYKERLKLVSGELQKHAIGCYTVLGAMKRRVRRAEYALISAQRVGRLAKVEPDQARLEGAWRRLLFNQFHDTLGGSSIAEAYDDAGDQLGAALSQAHSAVNGACLDYLGTLPMDEQQRIVVFGLGDYDNSGPLTHEPWLHPDGFRTPFAGVLTDESGNEIDYQIVQQSALVGPPRALVWDGGVEGGRVGVYRLNHDRSSRAPETDLSADQTSVESRFYRITPGDDGVLLGSRSNTDCRIPDDLCSVAVYEDPSDTWSHGIERYDGAELGRFLVSDWSVEESGPIRATLRVSATYGSSRLTTRLHLYRYRPWIDIVVDLMWAERFRVAKLIVPVSSDASSRTDGVAVGSLERRQDGTEYPFHDWTVDASGFGIVSPDCFGFDGTNKELRLTLVRSPVYAWHIPTTLGQTEGLRFTDQGNHRFRIRFVPRSDPAGLRAHAEALHVAPLVYDWTRGMR